MSMQQTDCREVDGHGKDDERHDPEDGFHSSQVGVVDTRLCTQLKKKQNHTPTLKVNAPIYHVSQT